MIIKNLSAKKILNSAGNETVECQIKNSQDEMATASIPSGISVGKEERLNISVDAAISQIKNQIQSQILRKELNQEKLDKILSNTSWGSNATLAVSAAFFKLANKTIKLVNKPKIMMLLFEGEKHGNPQLTIQEFMVVVDKISQGITSYEKIKKYLEKKKIITTVGSEGGFSPKELNDNDILNLITNLNIGNIALDIAGNINPPTEGKLLKLIKKYPIISIEDPFPEEKIDQWKSFFLAVKRLKPKVSIVADDLTVTDVQKIIFGAKEQLFDSVIIKPNQQGTITSAVLAIKTAKKIGLKTIISHRGEETNDDWIVDFAIKFGADFVKFGAPSRGERIAKYNRLSSFFFQ